MALNGIDISHWQGDIALAGIPFDFCICKATEGVDYIDPKFHENIQQVLGFQSLAGAYHFASGGDARAEADFFVSQVERYIGRALLALDFEYTKTPSSADVSWCRVWLNRVFELTGVRPLIYMSHALSRAADWTSVASDTGLWVARYADNNPTGYQESPWLGAEGTGAFPVVAIHQYTSHGSIAGYGGNLDLNKAYMTESGWKKYACPSGDVASSGKTITLRPGESVTIVGGE